MDRERRSQVSRLHASVESKFTDWRGARAYVSSISFFDAPSYFAETLCAAIPPKHGRRRLLDVGCGSGIVGIYCLLKGKADEVAGRAKRQVGEWTGDTQSQVEGGAQELKGKVQNAWGKAKDAARDATDENQREAEKDREIRRERREDVA